MATNPTFGCGSFLPGYGPFNFPDFDDTNGNTNGPNGGSTNQPPGGPSVPPGGEVDEKCECRLTGTYSVVPVGGPPGGAGGPPSSGGSNTSLSFDFFKFTAFQICKQIVNGIPADNSAAILGNFKQDIINQGGQIIGDWVGVPAGDCSGVGDPQPNDPCFKKVCPEIVIYYKIPKEPPPGRPPQSGPGGPGGPGLAGPATPTSPGPGIPGAPQSGPSTNTRCVCVIVESTRNEFDTFLGAATGGFGDEYRRTIIYQTECRALGSTQTNPNIRVVSEEEAAMIAANGYDFTNSFIFRKCRNPNTSNCDTTLCQEIQLSWKFVVPTGGVTESTPLPGGPGDPGDPGGGGIGEPVGDQDEAEGVGSVGSGEGEGGPSTEFDVVENQELVGDPGTLESQQGEGGINFISTPNKTSEEAVSNFFAEGKVDLSDPLVERTLLETSPTGYQDREIFVNTQNIISKPVPNTSTKARDLFADTIDSVLLYLLTTSTNSQNWDSTIANSFSTNSVLVSLRPEIRDIINKIKNYDGTPLSYDQIFSLIGTRVLDNTIEEITPQFLFTLLEASEKRTTYEFVRSNNETVNEIAALRLIESNFFPLDPDKAEGLAKNTLKNYKTFSSDVDRYIDIEVGGESQRYYVNDDDTFINRSTLSLQDGEYFDVTIGGQTSRFYAKSEKDHAFIVPENVRQAAINLLGGDTNKLLSVSGLVTDGIEHNYSLSTPRENLYFLSCVLDTVETTPRVGQSRLLNRTKASFRYVPTSTPEELSAVNEFIKFKGNYGTYVLNEEDLIFDYITSGALLTIEQDDILYESPKENKTNPILLRQLPRYIILYPTNREDFLVFNDKSTIVELTPSSQNFDGDITSSGQVIRQLITGTSISSKFNKGFESRFIKTTTAGRDGVNVFDEPDTQTRIQILDPDSPIYQEGFKTGESSYIETKNAERTRKTTPFRLAFEILTELDNNYSLGKNGVGKSITEFDLFSRFNIREFNTMLRSADFEEIKRSLFSGLVRGVKVVPALKGADAKLSLRKTQLVLRKSGAEPDTFLPTKTTESGKIITPPTEEEPPEETPPPASSPRPVTP